MVRLRRWVIALAVVGAWVGCDRPPAARAPKPTVEKFQCVRCHSIHDVDAPNPYLDCTGCHRAIVTDTARDFSPQDVARWKPRIRHLALTPSLFGVERLRRDWFMAFVQEPHGVRPGFSEEMPRMPISAADARALADELGLVAREPTATTGDAAAGAQAYAEQKCNACHWFSGSGAADGPSFDAVATAAQRRAPDLRFARERLDPQTIDAWLLAPADVKPDTLMSVRVTDPTVRANLVAYLVETPLEPIVLGAPPPLPEPVDREVTWEEVNGRVFAAVCQHCHTTGGEGLPGEGGAGNTGGFGYPGKGLVLSSWEGVRAGSRAADGTRQSVVTPGGDAASPLVAHMMARHAEAAGRRVDGVLGMPLGLPPIALEDIALVRAWIAQGAPGPK